MNYTESANIFLERHVVMILHSYQSVVGEPLLENAHNSYELARKVFYAPFALISHNTEADPVFNYANQKALELFEFTWDELMCLPSRLSAEPIHQAERTQLLAEVSQKGYIDNYQGVRIAKSGRRFIIKNATVWNLIDDQEQYAGQAAFFKDWQPLN